MRLFFSQYNIEIMIAANPHRPSGISSVHISIPQSYCPFRIIRKININEIAPKIFPIILNRLFSFDN